MRLKHGTIEQQGIFDCSKNRSSVDTVGLQLNFKKLTAEEPDMQFCELEKERGSQAPNSAFSVTIPRACEMPVGNTERACDCSAAVRQGMVIRRNGRASLMIFCWFYVFS